jgi:mRNA interferase RelE/StbE
LTVTYKVVFRKKAKRNFDGLDPALQRQIARKLMERCQFPRVPGDALSGMADCFKIKLRASGIRLVYRVEDDRLVLLVLAVGKREREEVYREAMVEMSRGND